MKLSTVCLLVVLLPATHNGYAASGDPVRIPGTHVSLIIPDNFVLGEGFAGIAKPAAGASVIVSEIPAPLDDMQAGMSAARLATRGMALRQSDRVRTAMGLGLLLYVLQNVQGVELNKWILIAGNAEESVLLTAMVPTTLADAFEPVLVRTLMTATWDPDTAVAPGERVGFTVSETRDLKISRDLGASGLILTEGGRQEPVSREDPLVVVSKSTAGVAIIDLGEFSKNRLAQTRTLAKFVIRDESALHIASMPAFELVAVAEGTDGLPISVYQAIAYDGHHYYVIQGFVGIKKEGYYLPQFFKIARSLRTR